MLVASSALEDPKILEDPMGSFTNISANIVCQSGTPLVALGSWRQGPACNAGHTAC
jgi:hypothetical protein